MNKKITNPHDKFFKSIFSQREEAQEFLIKTSPSEIVKKLHLETLKLDTTDYVDLELKEYFADVVYNCNYSISENATTEIKITFLFEHKSYKEHIPYLQLNRYLLNIWDTQIKQASDNKVIAKKFRLQPIIPIVFYHGKHKWKKQSFENYFSGMDKFLLQFLPKFDYHLIDMADFPNAKIEQLFSKRQLQVGLLLMKNIFFETSLLELLKELYAKSQEFEDKSKEQKFYEIISNYIYYSTNINLRNKIIEIMETLQTHYSQDFISIADGLKNEGKKEGEIQEKTRIAYYMIQDNFSNKQIIKLTGLTENQINYLRTLTELKFD